jgi:hypothetical protein
MPHNPTLARVSRKAAEQGYKVRQLTKGAFTLRQGLTGWPRFLSRIMRWRIGKLHAFGKLEEIEAWLDRDRRPM